MSAPDLELPLAVAWQNLVARLDALPADERRVVCASLLAVCRPLVMGETSAPDLAGVLDVARDVADSRRWWQTQDERRRTAYHESGHAVVGLVMGLALERATIAPNDVDRSLGHVRFADPLRPGGDLGHAERVAMMQLAGPLAEALEHLGPRPESLDYHRALTRALHEAAAPDADHGVTAAWCGYVEARAEVLVRRHRAWIEATAAALIDNTTVTADDVRALRDEPAAIAEAA